MRYWQIDFARGSAVILMLVFHFFFDARYFGKISFESDVFWFYFPRFIGGMFIFISGFSMAVSLSKHSEFGEFLRRRIRRSLELALVAALITAATYVFVRDETVVFGIIHFFAAATILAVPFARLRPALLFPLSAALFVTGIIFQTMNIDAGNAGIPLGIPPPDFATLDYYPLLPWFGVFLAGLAFGKMLKSKKAGDKIGEVPRAANSISLLGRNSLKIYLLQHPAILLILQVAYGGILEQIIALHL